MTNSNVLSDQDLTAVSGHDAARLPDSGLTPVRPAAARRRAPSRTDAPRHSPVPQRTRPPAATDVGMGLQSSLDSVVAGAWHSFDRAAALGSRVCPAVPVLFFGDLDAYSGSALRVVTVGLNPSLKEFPSGDPFQRFALAENAGREDPSRYLEALSAYFRTRPYGEWFGNYEPLLNGMGASYYNGATSTVLHTDICSPVATDPTWSHLSDTEQAVLADDGTTLWHELLEVLQPSVVVLSVAREHLSRIRFDPLSPWGLIHRFDYTADGALRARPYEAEGRWYVVGDEPSLFVFCPASQTPLGSISHNHRHELGSIVADTYLRGW